jgi:hypothetical protein
MLERGVTLAWAILAGLTVRIDLCFRQHTPLSKTLGASFRTVNYAKVAKPDTIILAHFPVTAQVNPLRDASGTW